MTFSLSFHLFTARALHSLRLSSMPVLLMAGLTRSAGRRRGQRRRWRRKRDAPASIAMSAAVRA